MGINLTWSCSVRQRQTDKNGCQVLCKLWELNTVNLNHFILQRYILENFVSNAIKCSICFNWFTRKWQNWAFALICDRVKVKVLRGHTPYNKAGIVFFFYLSQTPLKKSNKDIVKFEYDWTPWTTANFKCYATCVTS